jgi:hypothetical protein
VFELSVPSLDPNKQYCFEFEMSYRATGPELEAAIREGLDSALRSVFGMEIQVAERSAYDAFRQQSSQLIQRIARMKEAAKGLPIRVVPVEGAFFDVNTPTDRLPLAFRQQFTAALQAQARQVAAWRNIGTASGTAAAAAVQLLDNADFQRMIQQVQARADDPALSLRLTGLTSALTILDRRDALRAASQGLTAETAFTQLPPDQIQDPALVTERQRVIDGVMSDLAQLRDLAAALAATPALRDAAMLGPTTPAAGANPNALAPDRLKSVAQLIEDVREAFEATRFRFEDLARALGERQRTIAAMSTQMTGASTELVPFRGTTLGTWETRASQYLSADVGLARADPIDSTFFYLGTNIYTGPVNKRAELEWRDQSFRKRFAFMFGIPLNPFEEDQTVDQFANAPQTLEGVLGDRPLLIGAGWRLTNVMRATGGIVMFRVKDANPLLDTRPKTHFTWFMSLSTDWDIRGMFTSGFTGRPAAPPAPAAPPLPAPPQPENE